MKKALMLFCVVLVSFFACRKSHYILNFDQIDLNEIKKYENQFSTELIVIADQQDQLLIKPGTILFYKTNVGTLGKLRINSKSNTDLHCDFVNYDVNGDVAVEILDIAFPRGNGFDLDENGILSQDVSKIDFQWVISYISFNPSIYRSVISPQKEEASFYVYTK